MGARACGTATEHASLASARATAISDSSARASLYPRSGEQFHSRTAFVGQAQHFGPAVKTFAFVLLPVLVFLGIVTFARALEDAGQEQLFVRAISSAGTFAIRRAIRARSSRASPNGTQIASSPECRRRSSRVGHDTEGRPEVLLPVLRISHIVVALS